MKRIIKNKNLLFVCFAAVLIVLVAVVAFLWSNKKQVTNNSEEKYAFTFYENENTVLDNHHDIGIMIADCDDDKDFVAMTGGSITHQEGKYVQGTGAVAIGDRQDTASSKLVLHTVTLNEVDISAYADKTIHVSLYVRNLEYMGKEFVFELTSSGTCDKDELQWKIPSEVLVAGWNELYLPIADAQVTGTPDFSKINYYRMFVNNAKVGVNILYDCIYATDTVGMSLEVPDKAKETASTKKGYLMDADTLKGLSSTGKMQSVQAEGEVKEGAGAVAITNLGLVWLQADLQTFDLRNYQDGKITFYLYVNDSSYVKNDITVELSSSGACDKNEISWVIKNQELKNGWNEIDLFVSDAKDSSKEPIDFSKINYLRVWSKEPDEKLVVIFDAFRVSNRSKRVPGDGMILDCDTEEALRITSDNKLSLTTLTGEHKQGTGALKSVGKGVVWYNILFEELVDVSKYKDGGLHIWLYVSDKTKLEAPVNLEIGSGGKCDVDEYQWKIQGLKNGWNELVLSFESATVTGTPDLSNINFMRIFCTKVTDEITVIIDDVRAVNVEEKVREAGVILDCDDFNDVTVTSQSKLVLGNEDGEYKVGAGAYKSQGVGQVRYKAVLAKPVDISAYKTGALQMWLYVGDKSAFTSSTVTVEISSSGKSDNSEVQWNYKLDDLQENAWNKITLPFEEGTNIDGSTGAIDYKNINHFRLFLNNNETSEDVLLILDDVRAVEWKPEEPVPGVILSGDDSKNIASSAGFTQTRVEGEYKVGTGAFKNTGTAQIRYHAILKKAVDISAYKDGALQFWLYVGDTSEFNTTTFEVELNSSGKTDVGEIQWQCSFSKLKSNDWNLVTLNFEDGKLKSTDSEVSFDFETVNYFRLFVNAKNTSADALLILDDVHAIYTPIQTTVCEYLHHNAVYQAEKPMNIWGTSEIASKVKVQLCKGNQVVSEQIAAVEDGKWKLTLDGQQGGYTAYSVKVYTDDVLLAEYTDILFGEVWLAAGQSNMQLKVRDSYGGTEQVKAADDNYLRIFQAVAQPEGSGARTSAADDCKGYWVAGDTKNVKDVSAVAYNFAVGLRNELDIPVAIMETSMGSTTIEAWLSKEIVDTDSKLRAEMEKLGVYVTPTKYTDLGAMYYSKIAPLSNLNITGVLWYQGESNVARASIYADQLDLLKDKWGEAFGFDNDSMPFIFTQLAPYSFSNSNDRMLMTRMMDQMSTFYKENQATSAMVTNYDLSLQYTDVTVDAPAVIHPTVKKPIGERMALAAMGLVYDGEEATAPILESCEVQNGVVTLKFEHIGTGLKTTNNSKEVLGFAVCDENGIWVNATAELADSETVKVHSEFVTDPQYVSYAYCDMNTDANLCAGNGIPAAPFKTGGNGGFGSRSYLNCDGEIFVVTDFGNVPSQLGHVAYEGGHGEYKNLWTVSNRSTNIFDDSVFAQGIGSLKSNYDVGTEEVLAGIDLSEAEVYSVTPGLENMGKLSVKMKNGDDRQKVVRLALAVNDEKMVYTATQTLAASVEFEKLTFDLTVLYNADGTEVTDEASICQNAKKIVFCIQDSEAGTVWFDDMKLGASDNTIPVDDAGVIISGDSMLNIDAYDKCKVTNASGECKVGTGAFKSAGAINDQVRFAVRLKEAVDISAYEEGALQFWMYVGDKSAFQSTTMTVEINSGGRSDYSEISWSYSLADLEANSWNLVKLPFADGTKSSKDSNAINFAAINFMRIYLNQKETNENVLLILDDVRAVKSEVADAIFDFEEATEFERDFGTLTTSEAECKVGAAAFKSNVTSTDSRLFAARRKTTLDISAYKKNGGIQFWLYIGERSKLISNNKDKLYIELTSSGKADNSEIGWTYNIADLKENAWNLITLKFSEGTPTGTIDYANVNFMRMHLNGGLPSAGAVFIVDDVRAVHIKQIQSCDGNTGLTLGSLTTNATYRKINGAYLSENGVERIKTAFANTNIKNYQEGYLRVWIYLENDTTDWPAPLTIELTSSGQPDKEETQWAIAKNSLKKGWNEVHLPFKSGVISGISFNTDRGPADYSAVNFMRIFSNPAFTGKIAVDDIIVTTY